MRDDAEEAIDRGWFANERTNRTDEPSVVPTPGSDAPLSADRWEQVRATLETYEREVTASIDPRRRAALCYEIGRIHERELGDHRRAVRFYQRAFRSDPTHLPTLQAGQRIFARANRWAMVVRLAEAEVRVHPSHARKVQLLCIQGDIYLTRFKRPADALASFRRALELVPDNADVARSVAHAAAIAGQRELAAAALSRAARHEAGPKLARSLALAAAQAHLRCGKPDAAAAILEPWAVGEPVDPPLLSLLGRVYRTAGRWSAYVEVTARLAGALPPAQKARLLTELARTCAEQLDDVIGALALLDQAILADTRAPMGLELVVELRSRSGEWAAAAEALDRLVAITTDANARIDHLWQLALIRLDRLGDEESAMSALRGLLADTPTWQPAVRTLGRLLAERGDHDGLVALHEAELEAMDDPRARAGRFFKIGEIHELHRDDAQAAAQAYRRAVDEDPEFLLAGKALARMLIRLGDWEAYVALLSEEAERADDAASEIYAQSRIAETSALHLNDPDRAIGAWRRVIELQPDHLEAVRNIARLCARTGRWADLLDANERELELVEGASARLALLVRSAELAERALGDLERARGYLDQALAVDARSLPALQAMGRIARRTRRWSELCALYRAEAELTEDPRERIGLFSKIGEILRDRLDDPDGAIAAFEQALDLAGDHLPSIRALQRLYALKGNAAREAEMVSTEVEHVQDPHARAMLLDRLGRIYGDRMAQPELAAAAWSRAVEEVPDFRRALQGLIDAQAEAGDFEALAETHRRLARSAVTEDEAVAEWLEVARVSQDHLQAPVQAIDALETVRRLQPAHLEALLQLEQLYLAQCDAAELKGVYDALLETVETPASRADVLCRRARLHSEHLDDPVAAMEDYFAALEASPGRREALVWVETYAAESGDVERLAAVLQRRLDSSDAPHERQTVLSRAADVLRRAGRLEEAAHCYQAVLDIDSEAVVAMRALREVYEALGNEEMALRLAEAEGRHSLDPQTAAALLVEAGVTREAAERDPEGALADYLEALSRNPEDVVAVAAVRRICERTGRWKVLAEALEERALASPVDRVERMLEVAQLRMARLGEPDVAVEVLERAVDARSEAPVGVLQRLADMYTELGAWRQAAEVYAEVCARSTDVELRRAVVYRLATIYREKLADPERANACLRLILEEHPDDVEAHARLAQVALDMGDVETARAELEEAIALSEDALRAAPLRGRLGRIEADAGNLAVALGHLEPAVGAVPDDFELAELYAAVCVRLERPDRLRLALRRSIDSLASLPTTANRLRRLLAEQTLAAGGRINGALTDLEEAIAAAPDDPALRRTHAELAGRSLEHQGSAIASRRWLALRDPFDGANLRALRALCSANGRPDQAYELARLLSGLQMGSEEDESAIHTWHGGVRRWPARPLEAEDLDALRSPSEPQGFAEVLSTLTSLLPGVFAPNNGQPEAAPEVLVASARKVAKALASEPLELWCDERGLGQSQPVPGGLVLSSEVARLSGGERAFVVATHLELARRGLTVVTRWSPMALRGVLEALAAVGGHPVQGFALGADQLASRASALAPQIGAVDDPALGAALTRLRRLLPTLDIGAARGAFLVSAHRVALLVCGGVLAAVNGLHQMAGDVPVARVPGLADLIRWVVSEPYAVQRRSLGLAPAA